MADLVDDVRKNANCSVAEISDAAIVRELERARTFQARQLQWEPVQVAPGTVEYRHAHTRPWGELSPGTAGQSNGGMVPCGTIRNANGSVVTGWEIDRDGFVTFGSAYTSGSAYTFYGFGYDIARATVGILEEMAADANRQYDVDMSGDKGSRSQKFAMLSEGIKYWRRKMLARSARMVRPDEAR
jgi:hypothetical protein